MTTNATSGEVMTTDKDHLRVAAIAVAEKISSGLSEGVTEEVCADGKLKLSVGDGDVRLEHTGDKIAWRLDGMTATPDLDFQAIIEEAVNGPAESKRPKLLVPGAPVKSPATPPQPAAAMKAPTAGPPVPKVKAPPALKLQKPASSPAPASGESAS